MEYSATENGKALIIGFKGELTSRGLENTADHILQIVNSTAKPKLLLDFYGVEKLDSAGMGFVAAIYRAVKAKKRNVAVCHASPQAAGLCAEAELFRIIKFYETETEALEKL